MRQHEDIQRNVARNFAQIFNQNNSVSNTSLLDAQYKNRSSNDQRERSFQNRKSSRALVVFIIIVVAVIIAGFSIKKHINKDEQLKQSLDKLIRQQHLSLSNFKFVAKYGENSAEIKILNSNIKYEEAFLLFIEATNPQTNNNKSYHFGVYINKEKKSKSFLFSIDREEILMLTKPFFLYQIKQEKKSGPVFGQSDLQLFVWDTNKPHNKSYNSISQLCYSFKCPDHIKYGSKQAQEFLTENKYFQVQFIQFYTLLEQSDI